MEIIIKLDRRKTLVLGVFFTTIIILFYSYIVSLLAFVAPTNDNPLEVTYLSTLDYNNVPDTSFDEGNLVKINSTVEMASSYINIPISYDNYNFTGDITYRIIIVVMDPNKMPVFISHAQNIISPGKSRVFLDDFVLTGAASGTYKVRVLLWSDWLPGGIPLSPSEEEVTFTVP